MCLKNKCLSMPGWWGIQHWGIEKILKEWMNVYDGKVKKPECDGSGKTPTLLYNLSCFNA